MESIGIPPLSYLDSPVVQFYDEGSADGQHVREGWRKAVKLIMTKGYKVRAALETPRLPISGCTIIASPIASEDVEVATTRVGVLATKCGSTCFLIFNLFVSETHVCLNAKNPHPYSRSC